jgi:hypothetical protein
MDNTFSAKGRAVIPIKNQVLMKGALDGEVSKITQLRV